MHREDQMLGHGLAGAVAPTRGPRRTEDAIIVLGERRVRVFPENLGGAGEQHACSVPLAQLQHVASADHVHVENPERILHVVLDTDNRGQVENRVDTGSQGFFECGQIGDVALHEPEVGVPVEVDAGVAGVLGEVEDRDGVSTVQQCGDQVRSDQAIAARHDDIRHD